MKAIKSQGEKQVKIIEEHGKQLAESNEIFKKYDFGNEKHLSLLLKPKEINTKRIDRRRDEIL